MSKGIFSQALEKAKGNQLTSNPPAAVFRLEVEGTERTWMHPGGGSWMHSPRVHLGTFSTLNAAYEAAKADFAHCEVEDELQIELETSMCGDYFATFVPMTPEGKDPIDALYLVSMYLVDEIISEPVFG